MDLTDILAKISYCLSEVKSSNIYAINVKKKKKTKTKTTTTTNQPKPKSQPILLKKYTPKVDHPVQVYRRCAVLIDYLKTSIL